MPVYRFEIGGHQFEADHMLSAEEAQQLLVKLGGAIPPSTTTTATTTLPHLPVLGNAADQAQVAGGLGGGALGLLLGGPAGAAVGGPSIALAARGLGGAAMQPTSPGIGPVPAGQDFASRARRETLRGVPGEALAFAAPYAAPYAARIPGVAPVARGVSRAVGRLPLLLGGLLRREESTSLPELRNVTRQTRLPDLTAVPREMRELPLPGLGGAVRAEGAATTRTATQAIRAAFGRAPTDPEVGPKAVAKGLSDLLGRMPNTPTTMAHAQGAGGRFVHVPTAAAVTDKVYAATGLRISELSEGQIAKLLREEPKRLVEAFRILGQEVGGETGQALTRPVAESLVARAVSRAIRRPPGGAFPGAVGGGILDPAIMLRELGALQKRLGEDGVRAVWGPTGMQQFRQVTASLAGATGKLTPAGAQQTGKVTIRLIPLVSAMAAGAVGAVLGGRMGRAVEIAAGVGGLREMRDLLPRLLASEPGLRLVAAWLDGETRRVPDRLLIPALARMVPGVVRSFQTGGGGVAVPPMAPGVAGAFVPPQQPQGGYGP